MLTSNKDLRKVLREAELRGWQFRGGGQTHIKGRHPSGKTATISCSPSDFRVLTYIKRDLRT